MPKEQISNFQLSVLIFGFLYGVIINPAAAVKQDAWLASILASIVGTGVVFLYLYISLLNPGKTLIEILKDYFGKYVGGTIGLLYIWYFLHLAAIVIRNFGDFIVLTIFPETPVIAIIILLTLVIAYALRKGLEVMARASEILVPFIPVEIILVNLFIIGSLDVQNWKPFLEKGLIPVLKTVQTLIGSPVGELVIFLMIFPALKNKKDLIKTTIISVVLMSGIFLIINLRDLFVLGANLFYRATFPTAISLRLIPELNLEPFYLVATLLGGSIKVSLCLYAAAVGLTQIFNLDDYKLYALPLVALMVSLSTWLYDSLLEVNQWSTDNYFYYAFPFQFIFPIILLILSIYQREKKKKGTVSSQQTY